METGLILALISAVAFACGIVMARKSAGDAGESFTVTALSIYIGIPLFVIAITATGAWNNLINISLNALLKLAIAGVIHFVAGRLWAYNAFRMIGANRATPITQVSPVFTVVLSWWFLKEVPTAYIIFGALCMVAGVVLISRAKGAFTGEAKLVRSEEIKGILLSCGAALCWGISPVLVKPAVEEIGSAVVGNLVTYGAAAIGFLSLSFFRNRWSYYKKLSVKKSVIPMLIAGVFTAVGQLLYFAALQKSPAEIVVPLISIEVLFIYIISFFFNRRGEVFTWKVALGMAAMVAGTFLLFR